jgi:hypothetical protein
MPPIAKYKKDFLAELDNCRVLYRHCLTPIGPHSDAGVAASFLQMYKAWEALLEECTLSYMCGRLRADGLLVSCFVQAKNEEFARKVMYQEKQFVEWTDADRILKRWEGIFGSPNNLADALRPAKTELTQMSTIRNAVAHSSPSSFSKFKTLAQNLLGGRRSYDRPASLLVLPYPADPTQTLFDRYANVLEVTANRLTG